MNLLFIAPKFFNYEKKIIDELTSFYEKVIFKTEVPYQSSYLYYAIRRVSKKFAEKALADYNRKLIELVVDKNIDRIFIIRGFGINEEFLSNVCALKKKVEIFHYQWDSFSIVPNGQLIAKYADYNFSFDKCDVANNSSFIHLPLFSLLNSTNTAEVFDDILFVGTYHSDRINISNRIEEYCKLNNLIYRKYLFMPLQSYIRNLLQGNYIKFSDIKFRKLSYENYEKMILGANIIVDSPYDTQCGATMRTIEALSISKKIISTNKNLIAESFYNDINILILDDSNIYKINRLINSDFDHSLDNEILDLKTWLKKINIV
jgi:hypothetical protein